MIWTDGQGCPWRIEADAQAITLRSQDGRFRLDRADWPRDLYIAHTDQGEVIRFHGADMEAGFLVSATEADEFFGRIGMLAPQDPTEPTRPAAVTQREGPLWPTVTHASVWALILSCLAFLPAIGLLFGLAAVVLVIMSRLRWRSAPVMAHARAMSTVALVLALGGMAVSLLATYSFLHIARGDIQDVFSGGAYAGGYTYGQIAATIVVVILSLSIHECGHAIAAWWCGDDYAKSLGRVTLNPLAHIDLFGTLVLPILLTLANAPVFGYAKPVPVRLGNVRRYRRAHILISLAGPGANLMLAAVSLALWLALGCALALLAPDARVAEFSAAMETNVRIDGVPAGRLLAALAILLKLGFTINTLLAFFNLIPIPPLDGSWVLEHLFPNTLGRLYGVVRPFGFVIFLLLMYTDAFNYLIIPAAVPLGLGHILVRFCTGL